MLSQLYVDLEKKAQSKVYDPTRFFKTGPESYSAHDQFVGIKTPELRTLSVQYGQLSFADLQELLSSSYNEYRLLALFILVKRYTKADDAGKRVVYQFYMDHIDAVSNWNLVDSSAHLIVGAHAYHGMVSDQILHDLVVSESLWHRRIAIVATWYFIRQNSLKTTQEIAVKLLHDQHDLIHKAVGWMLREMGKKDEVVLRAFIAMHQQDMPRTMYRYAIERLAKSA